MYRIIKSHRGIYYIEKDDKIILCKARGLLRNEDIRPVVGDNVEAIIINENTGYIESVYERKNQLLRPRISNVDQVIIVMSIKSPNINLNLLDKYILMLEKSQVEVILLFNKIDLVDHQTLNKISDIYSNIGYELYFNSNFNNINKNILRKLFLGKITALAGPSGVGKSTTLNMIFNNLNFQTGNISDKTKRGKHTTRHVEMVKVDKDSYVIDTPGFSSLSLDFIDDSSEIKNLFREFREKSLECKFNNCFHLNEPSCGVKKAVENKLISIERYNNYKMILQEYNDIRRY